MLTVEYDYEDNENLDYGNPIMKVLLDSDGFKIKWFICCSTDDLIEQWKYIGDAIENNNKSELCYQVGGSSYKCYYQNKEFNIEFIIDNFENESWMIITLSSDIIKPIIDEINVINEYARRNEKYPNSNVLRRA